MARGHLERTVAVLLALNAHPEGRVVSRLVSNCNINYAELKRILETQAAHGLLTVEPKGKRSRVVKLTARGRAALRAYEVLRAFVYGEPIPRQFRVRDQIIRVTNDMEALNENQH
jgi:predicted transcriptional regulator